MSFRFRCPESGAVISGINDGPGTSRVLRPDMPQARRMMAEAGMVIDWSLGLRTASIARLSARAGYELGQARLRLDPQSVLASVDRALENEQFEREQLAAAFRAEWMDRADTGRAAGPYGSAIDALDRILSGGERQVPLAVSAGTAGSWCVPWVSWAHDGEDRPNCVAVLEPRIGVASQRGWELRSMALAAAAAFHVYGTWGAAVGMPWHVIRVYPDGASEHVGIAAHEQDDASSLWMEAWSIWCAAHGWEAFPRQAQEEAA